MYRALGASVFELLWLAGKKRSLGSLIAVEARSRKAWERARAGGRGVVVAASHTGNWDAAACAMAAEGELLVVTKRLTMKGVDTFWQGARARHGVLLCDPEGALSRGREVLARGGAVAMMIDQVPVSAKHAMVCEFLGAPALVDRAPAALAARARVPLVVVAERRTRGPRVRAPECTHEIFVLDVIEPPKRASRAWIEEATGRATRALDAFVRENPSEWLWMHRRWKGAS